MSALPLGAQAISLICRCNSLNTGTDYVRSRLAQYGSDLISLGLDGLRLDAAKRESLCQLL